MTANSFPLRVLMITSEWPTRENPHWAPYIVRQAEALRFRGIDVDVMHFVSRRRPMNYLRGWLRVRNALSRKRYDIIHAQWGHTALLSLFTGLPLVITFRGSDLEGICGQDGRQTLIGKLFRTVSQLMALRADQIVVVADPLARHLPVRSYSVVPSGLDLQLFQPMPREDARNRLGFDLHKRFILFPASPANAVKRYNLAQAAVEIVKRSLDAELLVATGMAPELMPVYMNACDVLILTSLHEGSPNVVKEALACNLPVVSVDVGDVAERIGGVPGCIVCRSDDPQTLAAGLLQVLERGGTIDGRTAVAQLDRLPLADKMIAIYRAAAEKGSGR